MSELEPILEGMKKGQTLEEFRSQWTTLPAFRAKCDEMTERVIRFLQQIASISISKIIKGGSACNNTFADHNQSHVVLYIFLNNLRSVVDMKTKARGILNNIKAQFDSASWYYRSGTIQFLNSSDVHSIRFRLICSDLNQQHTIIIFPAYDILRYKTVEEVYHEMMSLSNDDREYYSVCLGPKQVEFVKEAPSKLQDLIKIMKYWTETEVNADMELALSYFIDVLVMYRWNRAGKPQGDFSISDWFEEILSQLADLPSLNIVWEHRYTTSFHLQTVPPPPVVLDPTNPYKNLVPSQEYQDKMPKLARRVLRRMKKLREYKLDYGYKQSGPPPVLKDMRRGQTLQQFIVDTIEPDSDFRGNCDQVVERVTYFLQHHTKFNVSKVVKGGSLGKSTNILGKSDVDLVVFINELRSVKDLENNMEYLLTTLKNDLASKWSGFAGSLQLVRETQYGLQYKLSCTDGGHMHDVDILPACDILEDKSVGEIFEEMSRRTTDEREYYSVCFAPKQVEFVKQVPVKVKNLIRLVKYWAKTELNTEHKVVTSYFLECLVMYNWIERDRLEDFNTNDWFKDIMTQLANLSSMRILWPRHYQATAYYNIQQMFPTNPVFLDPGNPFINRAPL